MRARFSRSWALAKASWAVLMSDRSLLVYPIISSIAVVILGALILGPLFAFGVLDNLDTNASGPAQIAGLFVLYLVCYTAIFFCNTALVSVVMQRLEGVTTPVSGWSFARSRIGAILGYAAIAASVGVALRVLSDRSEIAGRIVAAIGGAVWAISTFLVVPVLVVEKAGPIDAIKRSAGLLKKTWGEQIIGNAGIGLATGLMMLGVGLVGGALILLAVASGFLALIVIAIAITLVALAIVMVVSSALDSIYRAALYRYATDHATNGFPAAELLPEAFSPKK